MTTFDAHIDITLDERLRRLGTVWRARHGVSARRFGTDALGDPGFVGAQMRGRSVRLQTADRVLVYMGYPPLGPLLRGEVEAFLAVNGTKLSILGEESVGNPSFVGRLRRGVSPRLATFDRVRAWMAANASEDELRAIHERLADVADPFAGTGDAAQAPPAEAGVESEGDPRMDGDAGNRLDTRDAAAWLGLSPKTLERYRVSGEGPVFHRFGTRVRYLLADIEAWTSAWRRVSASEERGARRRRAR